MYYVKMTALRPLSGSYGAPNVGEMFTTDNRTAEQLESRGLAQRYHPPTIPQRIEQTVARWGKMFTTPENKMVPVPVTGWLKPTQEPNQPTPRKRGRPPGSKNKPKP